jgi:hypothetical protein
MSAPDQISRFFKIRISSGEHRGFYVGPPISGLLILPTAEEEQALALDGLRYMLYTQESAAICFGSSVALEVQAELRRIGFDSELI